MFTDCKSIVEVHGYTIVVTWSAVRIVDSKQYLCNMQKVDEKGIEELDGMAKFYIAEALKPVIEEARNISIRF